MGCGDGARAYGASKRYCAVGRDRRKACVANRIGERVILKGVCGPRDIQPPRHGVARLRRGDGACAIDTLDEEQVATYVRYARVVAGVGEGVGGGDLIDADVAYIKGSSWSVGQACSNRHRGSIRGKSNTKSTFVAKCFAIDITT